MRVRILAALLLISCISTVSALGVIGAIDQNASTLDSQALNQVLTLARANLGSQAVSSYVRSLSDVTQTDLENNIVVVVKNGRFLVSAPPGSEASTYLNTVTAYAGDVLPFTVVSSTDVIKTGIEAQLSSPCTQTSGSATGTLVGTSLPATYTDLCLGSTLLEYSCSNGNVVKRQIDCPDGCSSGACVRPASNSSVTCPSGWRWTAYGYVCDAFRNVTTTNATNTIGNPIPKVLTPKCPNGCVSGERCVGVGTVLPDHRTCGSTGLITCSGGCELGSACVLDGTTAPDGRVCQKGTLAAPPAAPTEQTPPPNQAPAENATTPIAQPNAQLLAPVRHNLWTEIAAFFRNLFGRL